MGQITATIKREEDLGSNDFCNRLIDLRAIKR